jgi:uncharacterized protein (TIGR03066 family)
MRALPLVLIALTTACSTKKDAPASQPAPTPAAASPTTTAAPSAAPTRDVAKLPGTWHLSDNPNVVWTFRPDGGVHIKTSVTEYDGTYQLDGAKLTIAAKDLPTKIYDLGEVSDAKLTMTDTKFNDKSTWVH